MPIITFRADGSGSYRGEAWVTVEYSTSSSEQELVETNEDDLAEVFEAAKESGTDKLAGTGEPIEAAIDDPVAYRDFLILEDGEIAFDDEYVREDEDDAE